MSLLAITVDQSKQIFSQAAVARCQVIRGGRGHVLAADFALLIAALMPATGMQKALLQCLQLMQHHGFAVGAQGQRTQVFGLRPDPLSRIFWTSVHFQIKHCAHRTGRLLHAELLGEGKGLVQRAMQFRFSQQI